VFISAPATAHEAGDVPKPDHISDLERRQQALEDEIAQTMSHCSTDDPMIDHKPANCI
jgi:hypothetical protein